MISFLLKNFRFNQLVVKVAPTKNQQEECQPINESLISVIQKLDTENSVSFWLRRVYGDPAAKGGLSRHRPESMQDRKIRNGSSGGEKLHLSKHLPESFETYLLNHSGI